MRMLETEADRLSAFSSEAIVLTPWKVMTGQGAENGVLMPDFSTTVEEDLQAHAQRKVASEPAFRDMCVYWMALPRDGGLPDKAYLGPEFLPRSVLMNVVVFDVLRDPLDLVIRLIGSERRRTVVGKPLNQKLSERLKPELAKFICAHVDLIEATGRPVYSENVSNHMPEMMQRTKRVAVAFANRSVDPNKAVRLVFADLCTVEEPRGPFGPFPVGDV